MSKRAEKFHANKGCKFAIVVFISTLRCSVSKIKICGTLFKRYLHENETLQTPSFYMKMNCFGIVFRMT